MMSMRPSTYEWDGTPREGPIRVSQSRNVSFSIPHMPMSPLPSPMPLPIPSPVPDLWNYSSSAPSSPVPFTMMDQRMAQHQGMTMQQVNMQHQHPITGMPHLSYQEIQIYPHLTYEQQHQQQQHDPHHHHSSSQGPPHPIPMIYHPSSSSTSHPQIQVEYVDEPKSSQPIRSQPPRINPHTAQPISLSHPSPSSSNASTPKTQTSVSNQNNKRKTTSNNTSTSTSTSNASSPTPKRVRGRGKELELVDGQMVHLGQRRSRYARLLERMNAELMTCKLTLEQQKQRIQQLEEEKQKEIKQNQADAWRKQHSRLTTAGLYDIMYMSSPFMIVIFDLNLRIMDANSAYLNEHGWTMDEIFGRRVPTVQMQIFAHPKFDTSKHPVNDLDVPPLKAGLPPDISASDLIVTQETFMAFKYVYEGRAPAARIRMAEIDARGRLGLMQVHSYLHYEKGADMLGFDNNNNNNNIDGSSHDGHSPSVLSSPPASPAHVTSQMPIPYSRPPTPQDAYFLSLMSLKKPSFCPQRGQPMYFVSQCNIYERQILKTTPENDPSSHAFAAFHEPASILHHLQQGTLSPTPLMMNSSKSSRSSSQRSPAPYMSSNVSTPSNASSAETPPSPLTWTADVPHSIQDYEHMYKQQVSEYIQNHPEAVTSSRDNTALFPVPLPHDAVPQVKHSIPSKYASPFGPPKDDLAWLQSDVTQ